MGIADRKVRERHMRRRMIMDLARKLFRSKGYTATTMEDIARAAELSPATIYLYFRNKAELFGAISAQEVGDLLEQLKQIEENPASDPDRKLAALKEVLIGIYEADPRLLINVFNFQTSDLFNDLSPELATYIRGFSGKALGRIARIFEAGVRAGAYRAINPIAAADIIWGLFTGLVIWEESKTALDQRKKYMGRTLDRAFNMIRDGIKTPGRR
jgi:AcrR family transcriptional regulator